MKIDTYVKTVLTVIAFCLMVLVWRTGAPGPGVLPVAHAGDMGKLNYAKDGGVSVACSADGKYVYVAGNEGVVRSEDYGRLGSWEKSVKDD